MCASLSTSVALLLYSCMLSNSVRVPLITLLMCSVPLLLLSQCLLTQTIIHSLHHMTEGKCDIDKNDDSSQCRDEEGEEDVEGEESEDDDDDDDDDEDDVEVEDDDDPYAEFAMNMKEEVRQ